MTSIPFIDISSQFYHLEDSIRSRIDKVLKHGQFIMGPEVYELEEELSRFCSTNYAMACSSGTDALLMALMAYNVGPGDIIFTTPFSFVATAEVIGLLGAIPVFVDIDPVTFNLDVQLLDQAIRAVKKRRHSLYPLPLPIVEERLPIRIRGIVSVDLFGLPADYEGLHKIAKEHGLFLIEDAAQSFGGEFNDQKACALGDIGCTSFFPAKPLGAYGDAGAVLTSDETLFKELQSIRVHGQGENKYSNQRLGLNARCDTIQAAVLLSKLELFPQELQRREEIARIYRQNLSLLSPEVMVPKVPEGYRSAWAQYSVLIQHRELVQSALSEQAIPTNIYYEIPLHLQLAFAYLGYSTGDMPVSERTARQILSLPMNPYLEQHQIEEVCEAIHKALL
ncbi:MAG TPA: DegT/DnrJ/EryC1/StrS family aminotransferase [Desulfohalobiaceae bacterium]|nr:DegT/DnrJ/EryC1/StrS family aminotransferase [Desulfohalobiaceae bacterium]